MRLGTVILKLSWLELCWVSLFSLSHPNSLQTPLLRSFFWWHCKLSWPALCFVVPLCLDSWHSQDLLVNISASFLHNDSVFHRSNKVVCFIMVAQDHRDIVLSTVTPTILHHENTRSTMLHCCCQNASKPLSLTHCVKTLTTVCFTMSKHL